MFKVAKINGQSITFEVVFNEFHVSQVDCATREIVHHFHYKEHEIVDALAKYDDLILLQQIKITLNRKTKTL
jgi:hypothetical protein